ncbi:MAG: transglutaminase domain-containing protein [Lachnospiraceae bacterium]|nr:transglutaminase domain-containing protein [Lachnospiraceae bacterium]
MRKNMIFKRVTSLILSTTLLASNAVFTQGSEMQTEQVLMEESQSAVTENENEQETFVQQLEEETVACESTLETSKEETFADITQSVNESISTESEVQITEQVSEESEEQETETVQESVYEDEEESELASESASESETFDEFEDVIGVEEDYDDSNVYQEGEEFVKTFSIDEYRNVDSNPVYLGMAGISTATAKYYDQLDTVSKRIYDQIYEANKSGANTTKLKLNLTKIFENQTVTKGANGKTVYSEETKKAIFSWLGSYVTPAYLALTYDHPELVWLPGASYNIGYSVYPVSFPSGVTSTKENIELAGSTFTLKPNGQNGTLTASNVNSLFNQTKTQIDQMLSAGATNYDKVKAIHDKICSMVTYEDKNLGNAYYQTPYSLYIDADGDGKVETVCAGYAKMMKLQCDKYGIPCVLVTGVTDTGEAHMWNYIQLEDGKWYAVDATWDDQSSIMYDFFMVGSETYSSAAFGSKKFSVTHMPSGKWTTSADCVFRYPILSTNAYKSNSVVVQDGLVQNTDGSWSYYKNNKIDSSYTDLVQSGNDLIYIKNGVQNTSFTNLLNIKNKWYYVVKGKVNKYYTGIVYYWGTWYYIKQGVLDWNYTGLCKYNGTWYYIKRGALDWNYTGLCKYYGTWYYIKKGALDWNYTGLCLYYGTWYYIKKGTLDWNYTGLCLYYGTWYYIKKGALDWNYTGLCLYYGTWYYIKKGALDWGYTGVCAYYGTNYYIIKGALNWGYNGTITWNGKKHSVVWGVVK